MDAKMLNHEQFAANANAEGASRALKDDVVPVTGYMVGVPGLEERHAPPVKAHVVAAHATKMKILGESAGVGAESHQGAWRTTHGDKDVVVLDHSVRETNRHIAERMGIRGGQDAIWHLDTHSEIPLRREQFGNAPPASGHLAKIKDTSVTKTTKGTVTTKTTWSRP